jgi:hypothetical protein
MEDFCSTRERASEISSQAMPREMFAAWINKFHANNFSRHANPSGYRDIEHLIQYKKADPPKWV